MRIGSIAKKFNVSIDTVRYYIELGLLIPEKEKSQYRMNQGCFEDMALINELKQLRFSLKEIHKVLSLKRLTNCSDNKDTSYYTNLLLEKKKILIEEKNQISNTIRYIDIKINSNVDTLPDDFRTGVPLFFVPLFYCPHCHYLLNLKNASMQGQHIYEGSLHCACGYQAIVKEGILLTDQIRSSPNKYSIYAIDIKDINPNFVDLLEKGKLWMMKELTLNQLENKVFVETNIEASMLLPKYLSSLPENAYYIFTCHSLEMIKILKKRIEKLNPNLTVLYIVNSDLYLPLKLKSIDFFIDSFSFTQYSLIYSESPITIIRPYLKETSKIIGSFLFYESSAKSLKNIQSIYPTPNPNAFIPDYLEDGFKRNGLNMRKKEELGYTENPGSFFSYHGNNEKMNLLTYTADCNF
ncbi:MerR family transcriptional regulator [Peribacillus butanolivorans]|uniref:MerR family transcriptional regulator n=1 Tax=Peribacillus butanolivorans TaxID=421767 RepID=UPI00362DCB4C